MASWRDLTAQRPDLAEAGRALLYQFGVGLGFLATVRPDGGPRTHPMCPIIHDDRLLAFIVPSPKLDDLRRDGRYALHCFPPADDEDAFYVTGRATERHDPELREAVAAQFVAERVIVAVDPPSEDHALVELDIDTVLLTRTTGHGDPDPRHTVWKASAPTP
jgi:hypothetical protein